MTAMMVKKTGTVRRRNNVRMLGFSLSRLLEKWVMLAIDCHWRPHEDTPDRQRLDQGHGVFARPQSSEHHAGRNVRAPVLLSTRHALPRIALHLSPQERNRVGLLRADQPAPFTVSIIPEQRLTVHAARSKLRPPEMPVGRLLVGMPGGEDRGLVEGSPDDLEAHRYAVGRESARQSERGMSAHVQKRGIA